MLRAIRLENFRSFADSGRIELSDLNVFIGPNSAGKTNLMTVIELALRGTSNASHQPLALDELPSFASFDSVLRRNGSARKRRPTEFSIQLDVSRDEPRAREGTRFRRYVFRKSPTSGAAFVHRAEYGAEGKPSSSTVEAKDSSGKEYRVVTPLDRTGLNVLFMKDGWSVQLVTQPNIFTSIVLEASQQSGWPPREAIVVRPHRPIPRSVYVLDDPMVNADDRRLITDLLRIWSEENGAKARERILENLRTMTLAADIEVRTVARSQGVQMVEVRVTPQERGRAVTLTDVGYGVSQVLPLLSQDAQFINSDLLVYQPEAHLHPLAQSRLADVFVGSIKRGNRAYVETHSEHLVLRLQALIAGGAIDPDRVRVFCVEHDGKKSTVQAMLFDERGVPTSPWPKGFLDTGLDLARDLAQRRQSRPPAKKRDG